MKISFEQTLYNNNNDNNTKMSQNKKRKTTDGETEKKFDKSMLEPMSRIELVSLRKKIDKLLGDGPVYTIISGETPTYEFALVIKKGLIAHKNKEKAQLLNKLQREYFCALHNLFCELDEGSVFIYSNHTEIQKDRILNELKQDSECDTKEFETTQVTFEAKSANQIKERIETLEILDKTPVSERVFLEMDEMLTFLGF